MKLSRFQLIIVILAVLVGIGGFWIWQRNSYSKETLKFEILTQDEVVMGQELTYVVKYKNNGDVRLENPTLIFEYPAGAVPTEGKDTRITQSLEDIYPGQEQNISFTARLFGQEGEVKEAKAQLQYTPKNLSATFESETIAATRIFQVPLSFELDLPSRMEADQQFSFALNYFSNSSYPLSDLRIKMEYPEGFSFAAAFPSPIGEAEWSIGLLNRAEGGRISMSGTLTGEVQEAKIFKATLGTWREGTFTKLAQDTKGVEITSPRLLIAQEVNGSAAFVASPGDTLHYVISFRNVSDKTLENLFLVVALEGRPLDLSSVKSGAGTFQQGDNSIIFEAKSVPKLRFLGKGEQGSIEFWVNVADSWETFSPQDKDFAVRDRVILSDAKEEFAVKVNSKLQVEQKAYFNDEVFGNSGPNPPQAGKQSTYTVTWQAMNLYNEVANAKVKARLPAEVSLTGKIFPQPASLTFDQVSREVVWEIGDMPAGTGPLETPPSVSFQVRLAPVQSGAATLVGQAQITGEDVFTERTLSGTAGQLSTSQVVQ